MKTRLKVFLGFLAFYLPFSAQETSSGVSLHPQQEEPRIVTNVHGRTETSVNLGNGQQMILVLIPAGSFRMGSNLGKGPIAPPRGPLVDASFELVEADAPKPVHKVNISNGFWIGKLNVTKGQWETVMGRDEDESDADAQPMTRVSWEDCQRFISRLNEQHKGTFRLPTEAEWEYACRAGSTSERYGDFRQPNAWGLYDMQGVISQWCQDWYRDKYYATSPSTDPKGPTSGFVRVIRGGSLLGGFGDASQVRSAQRGWGFPNRGDTSLGFRLVRTIP